MSTVTPADAQTRAELLDLEERRQPACSTVTSALLDAIFDDDLVHIHAPGLVHTKAQLLEHVATRQAYLDIARGDCRSG